MSEHTTYQDQRVALQQLQQEVSGVDYLFTKWKQCLMRLPSVSQAQQSELTQQITLKLNNIIQTVGQFCFTFEKQMLKLKDILNSVLSKNMPEHDQPPKPYSPDYSAILRKIEILEKQLKYTKERGNKLQEALSILMSKEQNGQLSKNFQQQMKVSRELDLDYGEQSYTYQVPFHCGSKIKPKCVQEKCGKQHNTRDQDSNIYLLSGQNSNVVSSTISNPFMSSREKQSHFLRTLSIQNKQKLSLKMVPTLSRDHNHNPNVQRYVSLGGKQLQSSQKHQHRLNFMMKNLRE